MYGCVIMSRITIDGECIEPRRILNAPWYIPSSSTRFERVNNEPGQIHV